MSRFTSDKLIEGVKRRASIPTSQNLFSTEDFLGFINSEMESIVVPLILQSRGEYFVRTLDVDIVSGQHEYEIPDSSILMGLREAAYIDETNNELVSLEQISIDRSTSGNWENHRYEGYYFQGSSLMLHPIPQQNRKLRLFYHASPNEVVSVDSAGRITSIDTNTNSIVLDNVPTAWANGDKLNAIKSTPGFETKKENLEIVSISSPTVTLSSVEGLQVGQWVCIQGTSPIPQVPKESHKIIEQAVAIKCLEAMDAGPSLDRAERKQQEYIAAFTKMITPRSKGSSQVIVSSGALRLGRGRRFRIR